MLEPVKPLTTSTPSFLRRPGRVLQFFGRPGFTPSGSPSPQTCGGRIAWCRLVDPIEHGLADQVGADRVDLQLVAFQQIAPAGAIAVFGQGPVRPRNDRPSRPAPGRGSRSRRPCGPGLPAADRPIGR